MFFATAPMRCCFTLAIFSLAAGMVQIDSATTEVMTADNATCTEGVCGKGAWSFYLKGKTSAQCKSICEKGRELVPEPDGLQEDVYYFRQDGKFHNVMGEKPKKGCDETMDKKGMSYRGCQAETRSGRTCQSWTSQKPHRHSRTPSKYRSAGLAIEHNYCRNPDGEPSIWCYTTNPKKRWDYCDPLANETMGKKGMDYRGYQDKTRSGETCQSWASQKPHSHRVTPARYPSAGLATELNYCRNPDGEPTIWCYTTDPKVRWEYCNPLGPRKADQSRQVAKIDYPSTGSTWPGFTGRDHFYVRWSGFIAIRQEGQYEFYTTSDDGSKVDIDGKSVVQNPGWHGMRERSGRIDNMKAGRHALVVEMFEGGGGAGMQFRYKGPDTSGSKVIVTALFSSASDHAPKMMLNPAWKKQGACAGYSTNGGDCIIYGSVSETSTSVDNVCGDADTDWIGSLSTFSTCMYPPLAV